MTVTTEIGSPVTKGNQQRCLMDSLILDAESVNSKERSSTMVCREKHITTITTLTTEIGFPVTEENQPRRLTDSLIRDVENVNSKERSSTLVCKENPPTTSTTLSIYC